MIDVTGILTAGSYKGDPNSNGIFLYKDGSFVYAYKLPGFPFYSMTNAEKMMIYARFRNMLNQLDYYVKGEGSLYQFYSKKNYNWEKEKARMRKNILIRYDKFYGKRTKKGLEPKPPIFLEKLLQANQEDFFKIIEENELHKFDHYIIVKSRFNFNKYGLNWIDVLKNIFLNLRNDREIEVMNGIIENKISTHNSRFTEIKARPLTLIEMINLVRDYFGFSQIDYIPNSALTEENILKMLFPGKITYERDYIKTEEKVYIKENTYYELTKKDEEILEKISEQREKDLAVLNANNNETQNMEHDIKLIYLDLFKVDPLVIKDANLEELFYAMKQNIKLIFEKIDNSYFKNFRYFNKTIFNLYKAEISNKFANILNKEKYLRVFSVTDLPEKFSLMHGESLHSMYGDYTITVNFKKLDKDQVQLKMRRQIVIEGLKISMPVMKWFMPIEAIQDKIEMLRTLQRELEEAEFSRVDTTIYLTLRSEEEYDEREKTAMGQYESITKLQWMKEADAPDFHIFKGAMPTGISNGTFIASKRNLLLNTTNIAQIAPFPKEDMGANSFVLSFLGTRGIIGIDLNKESAGHFSVQGGTGGGKSVLGNKIALSYKALGDTIIVTEKGDSFGRTATFFGGKRYRPDISGRIKLNPFVMPKQAFENNKDAEELKANSYIQMIGAMKEMTGNFSSYVEQIYFTVLQKAFEVNGRPNPKYVKNFAVTPTTLLKVMKTVPEMQKLTKEIKSFERFTANGPYGTLFDGNEGLDMTYPYIHIDYSGLDGMGNIKDFVFKSLLQNIFFEMSKGTGRKFLNINDEFWDAIKTSSSAKDVTNTAMAQVEAFFRVARKLGGKIGVISQSIQDIADSPIKNAVISNIFHTFFTKTKASEANAIKDLFKLEEDQLAQITSLSGIPGKYSEYFVALPNYAEKLPGDNTQRAYNTKFKYFPTSFEYALFTTHPDENAIYNYMYNLMGADKPQLATQQMTMKAVAVFLTFFPNGVLNNFKFQEYLLASANDVKLAFKNMVEDLSGKSIKQVLKEISFEDFIKSRIKG